MRIINTQKRLGENSFQSVTIVQQLKGRGNDFIAKSEHRLTHRGKRTSSFSLSLRGKYKLFGQKKVEQLAEVANVRNLETALDAVLGLKPLLSVVK